MKNIHQLCLIALFLISASSLRLFMVGGHSYENSRLYYQLAAAVANRQPMPGNCEVDWKLTKCPKAAVITSSHQTEAEGNDVYYVDDSVSLSYQHIFLKAGMAPAHISTHADNYQETARLDTPRGKANLEIIQQADILYFTGGDQSKHVRAWLNDDGSESPLLSVIRNRAFKDEIIVSGSSAGSMTYGQKIFGYGDTYGVLYFANSVGLAEKTVPDASVNGTNLADTRNGTNCTQFNNNAGKMPGYKWVDVIFDTHFTACGRIGRIAPIMVNLQREIGFGIDENTSIFYENGQGKVYGEKGVTIVDISQAQKLPGKYFRLQNVKVHFLTEGDRYDFKTKVVTSSKPLITTPQYKNSTDSEDIFNQYDGSLLLTRLVDQTALFNRGRSVVPDDYPEGAPVFELTFSKSAQTKGYRQGEAYTVSNAILEYSYLTSGTPNNLLQEA